MASPYSVGFERWRWEEDVLLLSARNRAVGLIEKENDGPNLPPQYLAFPPHQTIPWVLGFPSLFEGRALVSQTQRKVFPPRDKPRDISLWQGRKGGRAFFCLVGRGIVIDSGKKKVAALMLPQSLAARRGCGIWYRVPIVFRGQVCV